MIFSLEVLNANEGDSLLLHYGNKSSPHLMLIDGGPKDVFSQVLGPRLTEIMGYFALDEDLPIRLMMVSHVDGDHIRGILDLTEKLVDEDDNHTALSYDVTTLWVNTFEDTIGKDAHVVETTLGADVKAVGLGGTVPAGLPLSLEGAAMVASVKEGRELLQYGKKLNMDINDPCPPLIVMKEGEKNEVKFEEGMKFTILGPGKNRIDALREEWKTKLKKILEKEEKEAKAEAAKYIDESVYNLSSIVVLSQMGNRKILLTGDALGKDVVYGLEKTGLLEDETFPVDILKVPHHGSDANVTGDFFAKVPARHYVFSGNGKHDNPEIDTLKMLIKARGDDVYTMHFTYMEQRIVDFFKNQASPGNYSVKYRKKNDASIIIDLEESLPF